MIFPIVFRMAPQINDAFLNHVPRCFRHLPTEAKGMQKSCFLADSDRHVNLPLSRIASCRSLWPPGHSLWPPGRSLWPPGRLASMPEWISDRGAVLPRKLTLYNNQYNSTLEKTKDNVYSFIKGYCIGYCTGWVFSKVSPYFGCSASHCPGSSLEGPWLARGEYGHEFLLVPVACTLHF